MGFVGCIIMITYACRQCPEVGCLQAFKKHAQLAMHVTRHSGDPKPFKCTEEGCDAAFVWPSELRKHLKWHKGGLGAL